LNAREREEYLREYSILKTQGKPFFPYAIAKDGAMAAITIGVIIVMAILFGAELGPKADPTTTTYTPRPEWYFFFLFELLRVVKPPALVFLATIGIPTICLMLLIMLPFFDRNPERNPVRRPIATTAGIAVICAMAYLSIEGALAGPPTQIELATSPQYEEGKEITATSGCLACHKIGDNGNTLGPALTDIGHRAHPAEPHLPYAFLPVLQGRQPGAVRQARAVRRLAEGRVGPLRP
jgi:menaquinol-cytochrome c reductase cytochrome b/c subunit